MITKLAIFDLEYMFLQIRGKSVGETVDLFFMCDEDHGEQNEKAKSKSSSRTVAEHASRQ